MSHRQEGQGLPKEQADQEVARGQRLVEPHLATPQGEEDGVQDCSYCTGNNRDNADETHGISCDNLGRRRWGWRGLGTEQELPPIVLGDEAEVVEECRAPSEGVASDDEKPCR